MGLQEYWLLTKFIAPLGLTTVSSDVAEQVLNRGLTSTENATEMLATFGIAYTLTKFASGPFQEFKNISLVLVHSKKEGRTGLLTLLMLSTIVVFFAILVAFTGFGYFITNTLYTLNEEVGHSTRQAVLMLSFFPLFHGLSWYIAGYLLQFQHSVLVGSASVIDVVVQILTVVGLLQSSLVYSKPVLIPIVAVYTGVLTRFSVLLIGFLILRRRHRSFNNEVQQNTGPKLTILRVLLFWWPLAIVQAVQKISRPLVNLFVARDLGGSDEAIQAIAVLSVVYPIGRIPFGWLNELKSIQPTFYKGNKSHNGVSKAEIRTFDICCVIFALMVSFSLFWIPDIVINFYTRRLNLSTDVAYMCIVPLKIFSIFPLFVGWRSHNTSWLLMMKNTVAIFPSAVIRLIFLISVLNALPQIGLHGAPLGITSLLISFIVETCSVHAAVTVSECRMKQNSPLANVADEATTNSIPPKEPENTGHQIMYPLLNGDRPTISNDLVDDIEEATSC